MAFPTAGLINKLGIRNVVLIAIGCAAVGSAMGALTEQRDRRSWSAGSSRVRGWASWAWRAPRPSPRGSPPRSAASRWASGPCGWRSAMCICPVLYGYAGGHARPALADRVVGYVRFDIVVGIVFVIFYREPERPYSDRGGSRYPARPTSARPQEPDALGARHDLLLRRGCVHGHQRLLDHVPDRAADDDAGVATGIASVFGVVGAICAPLCGKISDWLKTRKWVLLFALIGGVAYTAVVFTCQVPELYWGIMILAGIVGGSVPSIIWAATPDTVRPRRRPRGERASWPPRRTSACSWAPYSWATPLRRSDGRRHRMPCSCHATSSASSSPLSACASCASRIEACTAETVPFEGPFPFVTAIRIVR